MTVLSIPITDAAEQELRNQLGETVTLQAGNLPLCRVTIMGIHRYHPDGWRMILVPDRLPAGPEEQS